MPKPQDYVLFVHEERHSQRHRHPQKRRHSKGHRHRSRQRHSSAQSVKASTASNYKLVPQDESSKYSHKTHKKGLDFLLTNGSIYPLKVDPPVCTELVRLQRNFTPLKPNYPIPEYRSRSGTLAPRSRNHPEAPISLAPTTRMRSYDSGRSCDDVSSYNFDSDLSTKEEAVALKLSNIIQQMETKMHANGKDKVIYVHNPGLEQKRKVEKDPRQPTYIKIIETFAIEGKPFPLALIYSNVPASLYVPSNPPDHIVSPHFKLFLSGP
ncbi:hypothetical protein ECG_01878 [Echinococcus granulosus]|nr:hypothetical protein ECG_01878 [Echinococcus granulosus]